MARPFETPLEMAQRHVTEGEERCRRQGLLVQSMAARGQDTAEAERLLMNFEQMLTMMRADLQRLRDQASTS